MDASISPVYALTHLILPAHLDLARPHRVERGRVTLGRDARAAGGVDTDALFGAERLHEEGIRDDADIRAEPNELDRIVAREGGGECRRAERGLFDHGGRRIGKGAEFLHDRPARRAANAVRNRQMLPLLRHEIVRAVRIHGKDECRPRRTCRRQLLHHTRWHRPRLCRAECSAHEVVLHIHNDNSLLHCMPSILPMLPPLSARGSFSVLSALSMQLLPHPIARLPFIINGTEAVVEIGECLRADRAGDAVVRLSDRARNRSNGVTVPAE